MLWRMSPDSFRLTIRGDFKPLLTNPDYILMDKKYTPLLKTVADQITLHNVIIYDLNRKTEINHYVELKSTQAIDPDIINAVDSKGMKIWAYSGELFVSTELKENLLSISDTDFTFSLGFSHFGGLQL